MFPILIVLFGLGALSLYALHVGAGARLQAAKDLATDTVGMILAYLKMAYYRFAIPAVRRMSHAVLLLVLAGGAVGLVLTHEIAAVPTWVGVAIFVFSVASAVLIRWAAAPQAMEHGQITIPAGDRVIRVNFPPAFQARLDESPVIFVTPWDSGTEYSVEHVTPTGFSIALGARTRHDVGFRWTAQVRPAHEPIVRMVSATFWSVALMAIGALVIGLQYQARAYIWLSIPFAIFAVGEFFLVYAAAVQAASAGATGIEYPFNAALGFVRAVLLNNAKELEKFVAHLHTQSAEQLANLFNQEAWKKNRARRSMITAAILVPVYSWALLIPKWSWFAGWRLVEIVGAGTVFLFTALASRFRNRGVEEGDLDLIERAEWLEKVRAGILTRGLIGYAILTLLATLAVAVGTVDESFARALDTRTNDSWHGFLSFTRGGVSIPLPDWKIGIGAIAIGVMVFYYIIPSKDAKLAKPRMWAGVPLLILCGLVGIGGIVRSAFAKDGSRIALSGFRKDGIAAPSVHVQWFKVDTAKLSLSWEKAAGAVDYWFEWRTPSGKDYAPLPGLAGGFGEGITHWEGAVALPPGEVLIRMRAVYRKDGNIVLDRSEPSADVTIHLAEGSAATAPAAPSEKKVEAAIPTTIGTTTSTAASPAAAKLPVLPAKPCTEGCELPKETLAMCAQLQIPCD